MTETLLLLVAGLVVIAASTVVGPRLGVAAPLLLVAVGVGASFLPSLESVEIDPELILAGVLPPLLYSSAVSMPAMNFRREFGAISGLSKAEREIDRSSSPWRTNESTSLRAEAGSTASGCAS